MLQHPFLLKIFLLQISTPEDISLALIWQHISNSKSSFYRQFIHVKKFNFVDWLTEVSTVKCLNMFNCQISPILCNEKHFHGKLCWETFDPFKIKIYEYCKRMLWAISKETAFLGQAHADAMDKVVFKLHNSWTRRMAVWS